MRTRLHLVAVLVVIFIAAMATPALASMETILSDDFDTLDTDTWYTTYWNHSEYDPAHGNAWASGGVVTLEPSAFRGATVLKSNVPITELPARVTFAVRYPTNSFRHSWMRMNPTPGGEDIEGPFRIDWRYGTTNHFYSGARFFLNVHSPAGSAGKRLYRWPTLPVNSWIIGELTLTEDRVVGTINGVTLDVTADVRGALDDTGELYPFWGSEDDYTNSGQQLDWVLIEQAVTDETAPEVTASLAGTMGDNGWYTSDVAVSLSATDDETGVESIEYSLDGGTTWLSYGSPIVVGAQGSSAVAYRATDGAGNTSEPGSVSFKIDSIAPAVAIVTPADGVSYLLGSTLVADWTAVDGGSGIADVTSTAADGDTIDTSAVGAQTFVVSATDAAGNTASAEAAYTVAYVVDTSDTPASGKYSRKRTLPVKLWLFDAAGTPVTDASLALTIAAADADGNVTGERVAAPADAFKSNPDGKYQTNLRLRDLDGDSFVVFIELDDGSEISFHITLK